MANNRCVPLMHNRDTTHLLLRFLPVVAFAFLYVWRPLFFGFIHDDWSIFVVPNLMSPQDLWEFSRSAYQDRPSMSVFLYFICRFWNGEPSTLVMITSCVIGVSAVCFYGFLRLIEGVIGTRSFAAEIGAALWICAPWGLGYMAWNSGATTLLAQIFFLISAMISVSFLTKGGWWRMVIAALALAISFMAYEAFYLAYIPVLLLVLALRRKDTLVFRRSALLFTVLTFVQVGMVLITLQSTPKHVGISPLLIFGNVLYKLPEAILVSFGWLWPLFVICLVGLIYFTYLSVRNLEAKLRLTYCIVILALLIGIAIGTLPFSIANYPIHGLGVFSRTTMGANIWICTLIALIWSLAVRDKTQNVFFSRLIIGLIILSAAATSYRLIAWKDSWVRQQEILATIQPHILEKVPANAAIILDEPMYIDGVEVFAATWDISSAVYTQFGLGITWEQLHKPRWYPLYTDLPMTWDNKDTLMVRPGNPVRITSLWRFVPTTGLLTQIKEAGVIKPMP